MLPPKYFPDIAMWITLPNLDSASFNRIAPPFFPIASATLKAGKTVARAVRADISRKAEVGAGVGWAGQ